jgi:acyl-[acyl-carrier-protein]-phospholipid O-acyltransferase/long-chain-fatty-acid--[acyl-carrier-protein] ligase
MQGYLGRPDLTAEVLTDGWYATGDIAAVDADGFIRITGRASRFSKIGGEMVPHVRVEELIGEIVGDEAGEIRAAVAAVPDQRKGERLVVLHCGLGLPADEICRRLLAEGLPPLWVPTPDSFRQVVELPLLGTGKLDLARVRAMALAEFGQ